MSKSILDPLTCGFVKVVVYEILTSKNNLTKNDGEAEKNYKGRIFLEKYKMYHELFGDEFDVEHKLFVDKFPSVIECIKVLANEIQRK